MIKTTKEEIIKALDDIRCDWIVLNFKEMPNHFECKRCGKMAEAPQDCRFDQYFAQLRGFKMAHWDCVEIVATEDVVSEAVHKGILQVEENVGTKILYGTHAPGEVTDVTYPIAEKIESIPVLGTLGEKNGTGN